MYIHPSYVVHGSEKAKTEIIKRIKQRSKFYANTNQKQSTVLGYFSKIKENIET